MSIRFALGVVGALTAAAGIFSIGKHAGRSEAEAGFYKGQAELTAGTLAAVRQLAQRTESIAAKAEAQKAEIRTNTITLMKEVPRLVPAATDARYPLPVGLVRVHDAAATGAVLSGATSELDDAASPVAASQLASTLVANYGGCREDQKTLAGLQAWASTVSDPPH